MHQTPYVICWLRRDLRLTDQTALFHALNSGYPVQLVFIFDREILDKLEDRDDRRVTFIHNTLREIDEQAQQFGSRLHAYYGRPLDIWQQLAADPQLKGVYLNRDYEPYARERDSAVSALLRAKNISFNHYKDQVICEANDVLKDDGKPYTVFTPYSRKWKAKVTDSFFAHQASEKLLNKLLPSTESKFPTLEAMGFRPSAASFPDTQLDEKLLRNYHEQRNIPAIRGTSRLGLHLRFGTLSIRSLAARASAGNETFLNELIWRDFYQMILWHFPHAAKGAFKPAYDQIPWRNDVADFERWCNGTTGYPIVDAGMRELAATGFMHNRVRMIVASFLTKHLLIDWRWGEAWFARHLLDFDLAANNGGWQWAAGSGCDAAPYFRVFNPSEQTKKFDASGSYIRQWVPEIDSLNYPKPMVDHAFARKRALDTYAIALKGQITETE